MMLIRVLSPVRRAARVILCLGLFGSALDQGADAANVTLAWDASTDPAVTGYRVYFGAGPRNYTNMVTAGSATSISISNLLPSATYYFAATCVNLAGLESDFSTEVPYTVPAPTPVNTPPTLNPIPDLTLEEDAGPQTITLSGITSGSSNEVQTLTLNAFSSDPGLISNPTVDYASPGATGSLSFTVAPGSFGSASITVMVDDGGSVSNTIIRSFVVTVFPVNNPPSLDLLRDLTIDSNAGPQTVALTGINSGASNEVQPLTVTAISSTPSLIPNPTVTYTSPSTTGTLTLVPRPGSNGTAAITVTVSDGQPSNGTTTRSFNVSLNPAISTSLLTNAIIVPNQSFVFVLKPPLDTGRRFTYNLDASAPAGANIQTKRNVSAFLWAPTPAQALTTNLITIHCADNSNPPVTTNETLQVTVLDYLSVIPGSVSVQAGQGAVVPIAAHSSGGLTNVSFTLAWPTERLGKPSLTMASPAVASGTVQLKGTNLLVRIQTLSGQSFQPGSNLVAQLSFPTIATQPSAMLSLAMRAVSGQRADGQSYLNCVPQAAQVVIVNDVPILQSCVAPDLSRSLLLYGRVGITYQLLSNTNLANATAWTTVATYTQTNLAQSFAVSSNAPVIWYRIKQ